MNDFNLIIIYVKTYYVKEERELILTKKYSESFINLKEDKMF